MLVFLLTRPKFKALCKMLAGVAPEFSAVQPYQAEGWLFMLSKKLSLPPPVVPGGLQAGLKIPLHAELHLQKIDIGGNPLRTSRKKTRARPARHCICLLSIRVWTYPSRLIGIFKSAL